MPREASAVDAELDGLISSHNADASSRRTTCK
jgi:hypothetical protein